MGFPVMGGSLAAPLLKRSAKEHVGKLIEYYEERHRTV